MSCQDKSHVCKFEIYQYIISIGNLFDRISNYGHTLQSTLTPARTSEESDICEDFTGFLIEVLQRASTRKCIWKHIYNRPVHATQKIILHNYILY